MKFAEEAGLVMARKAVLEIQRSADAMKGAGN
jgi:hypothetical protein